MKILRNIIIAIITLTILLVLWTIYNQNKQQVPVLVYHNIVPTENEKQGDVDTLTIEEFKAQMNYLKESGYEAITVNDLYEWKENKKKISKKSVVITFDDGFYSFKYLVQPVLEEYNFNAICFIIGKVTGDTTPDYDPLKYGTIGLDEIRNHIKNVEYGSHTYMLHDLDENNQKMIDVKSQQEIEKDVKDYNSNLFDAKYLAYPYYTYNKDLINALKKEGYKLAFAGEEEMATKGVNNYKVPRINGVRSLEEFKEIFETNKYKNKYGNGIARKVIKTIQRKITQN